MQFTTDTILLRIASDYWKHSKIKLMIASANFQQFLVKAIELSFQVFGHWVFQVNNLRSSQEKHLCMWGQIC